MSRTEILLKSAEREREREKGRERERRGEREKGKEREREIVHVLGNSEHIHQT